MNKFINFFAKILTTILFSVATLLIAYHVSSNENVSLIISVVVALVCYAVIDSEQSATI